MSTLLVKNFYSGAFVYASGCRLLDVVPNHGRSAHLIFDDKDGKATKALEAFNTGQAISGKDLFEALGTLKREANAVAGR